MKILFLNPPTSFTQKYKDWDLSDVKSSSPPLGMLYLASVARRAGHTADFLDLEVNPSAFSTITSLKPDLVAMTAMTINANSAIEISKKLKSLKVPIILGGVHATACPKEMESYELFDRVFVGEGERDFNSYIGGSPFGDSLDDLPHPSYDLVDWKRYRLSVMGSRSEKSIGLVTSRGCFGKCHFCSRQIFGNRIRCHSVDYILDDLYRLKRDYGVSDFLFYDDLFVANKERLREFCERVKGISWSCCARVDTVTLQDLKLMKSAGCWLVEYGIESGSQVILDKMGKGINLEKVEKAIESTRKAGIKAKGNFIFGYVGESHETLAESLRFISRCKLDYFQHTFFTPLPGTDDYERAERYGEVNKEWTASNTFSINFIPKGLTREDLILTSRRAFLRFYLHPLRILRLLPITLNWRMFTLVFKAFLKTVLRSS